MHFMRGGFSSPEVKVTLLIFVISCSIHYSIIAVLAVLPKFKLRKMTRMISSWDL